MNPQDIQTSDRVLPKKVQHSLAARFGQANDSEESSASQLASSVRVPAGRDLLPALTSDLKSPPSHLASSGLLVVGKGLLPEIQRVAKTPGDLKSPATTNLASNVRAPAGRSILPEIKRVAKTPGDLHSPPTHTRSEPALASGEAADEAAKSNLMGGVV